MSRRVGVYLRTQELGLKSSCKLYYSEALDMITVRRSFISCEINTSWALTANIKRDRLYSAV